MQPAPNYPSWLPDAPWLHHTLWGNEVWQYIGFFLYCLAAVAAARLADVLFSDWLRRLTARTRTEWDDRVIRLLAAPVRVVAFLVLFHIGLELLRVPEAFQVYLRRGVGILIAAAVTYVLVRTVDVTYDVLADRFRRHDSRLDLAILLLLRRAIKVFLVTTAIIVTADNIGIKVTGVLASLGVTGLAVALASQETLANLLGAIVVLADRMFVVGDRIRVGTEEGVVEHIGIRSTRLRTIEGDIIAVPNRNFTTMSVRNYSRTKQPPPASNPG